jgi:hypothetical protein
MTTKKVSFHILPFIFQFILTIQTHTFILNNIVTLNNFSCANTCNMPIIEHGSNDLTWK